MKEVKSIHAKPSLYAYYFYDLKAIALKYGYNLVIHGSLNRDLDLIAIPWQDQLGDVEKMIDEMSDHLGGSKLPMTAEQRNCFPHGRISYVINLNRGEKIEHSKDPQYYIDISVIRPALSKEFLDVLLRQKRGIGTIGEKIYVARPSVDTSCEPGKIVDQPVLETNLKSLS